ncbi:Peptidyl-prolyl cis-trans isomerase pin1 [Spathaspora sp. JA1]|nr:Peptidyl-prolyl cis-trans isomerase pin1 [Spathaspora sp. JA1]
MTNTGLPTYWTIRVSHTYNQEYFYNQSTKQSSWDVPFGTDEQVLSEYLKKFKDNGYKPVIGNDSKVRVSHLLVKNTQSRRPKSWKSSKISRSRDESIHILKKHLARILNGDVKLCDLAKVESDCSSHVKGGDVGFFGKGEKQPMFEETAYGLHVGEISDVIETASGVHILERTA